MEPEIIENPEKPFEMKLKDIRTIQIIMKAFFRRGNQNDEYIKETK